MVNKRGTNAASVCSCCSSAHSHRDCTVRWLRNTPQRIAARLVCVCVCVCGIMLVVFGMTALIFSVGMFSCASVPLRSFHQILHCTCRLSSRVLTGATLFFSSTCIHYENDYIEFWLSSLWPNPGSISSRLTQPSLGTHPPRRHSSARRLFDLSVMCG